MQRPSALDILGPQGTRNAPRQQNSRPTRSHEVCSRPSRRVERQEESYKCQYIFKNQGDHHLIMNVLDLQGTMIED